MSENWTLEEWTDEYKIMLDNPPEEGDFVVAEFGDRIKLDVDIHPGKPVFIFTRLYVSPTYGTKPDWFAQGENQKDLAYGLKLVLAERSRGAALQRCVMNQEQRKLHSGPTICHYITCARIRILRKSLSGQCLVGEVVDW